MRKKIFKLFFILLFPFFSLLSQAQAGLFIEPYLGYRIGSGEQTGTSVVPSYDLSGVALGARAGFTTLLFSYGLQYELGLTNWDSDTSADLDANNNNSGAFIAFDLSQNLRLYGTYFFDYRLEDSDQASFVGDAIAVGLGLRNLAIFSINFEYRQVSYDELTRLNGDTTTWTDNVDQSEFLISISLPINI